MKVSDVMTRDVVTAHPGTPLKEVARLMATYGISGLPVVDDEGTVVGIVSEADFLIKGRGHHDGRGGALGRLFGSSRETQAERDKIAAATAGELMTSPAITIETDAPVRHAAALMVERHVNRLPVARDGHLVGIVTRADVVRAYLRPDDEIRRLVRDEIVLRTMWIAPETVDVEVAGGVVHLAGTLDRRSSVETLVGLVQRLDGVVKVESDLRWQFDDDDVRLPEEDLIARGYRK
jgi:CBS domain-containing protein